MYNNNIKILIYKYQKWKNLLAYSKNKKFFSLLYFVIWILYEILYTKNYIKEERYIKI